MLELYLPQTCLYVVVHLLQGSLYRFVADRTRDFIRFPLAVLYPQAALSVRPDPLICLKSNIKMSVKLKIHTKNSYKLNF